VIAGYTGNCGTVMFRQLYPSSSHSYRLLEIPGDEKPHSVFEDESSCVFTWHVMLQQWEYGSVCCLSQHGNNEEFGKRLR
jgi:hypothetical protein